MMYFKPTKFVYASIMEDFVYISIMEDCAFYMDDNFSISRATLSQGIVGHVLMKEPQVESFPTPLQ